MGSGSSSESVRINRAVTVFLIFYDSWVDSAVSICGELFFIKKHESRTPFTIGRRDLSLYSLNGPVKRWMVEQPCCR